MSAPACIVYYGVRFELGATEIEGLETRTDGRIAIARKSGLKFYWGNFGSPDERYLLFIGAPVGIMGIENQTEVHLNNEEFDKLVASVRTGLESAGIVGAPQLHIEWQHDG